MMAGNESDYLTLLRHVLEYGDEREERTGVGTRSIFGALLRFDASESTPILTTKRVSWKTAVKEMLWFIKGETNIRSLLEANVRIWTDWPLKNYRAKTGEMISQEAFESRILDDEKFANDHGALGPVYGKQWRRWLDNNGQEHDQIQTVIKTLKENPTSRRMLFHAWNVGELHLMEMPPCHLLYQFHVTRGRLSLMLMQRSVDLILGCPFNWVGASALQLMIAQQAGLEPGEFVWVGGDVHLYLNHLDQAREQIGRTPRPFPRMRLTRHAASIDDYRIEDFEVTGYDPHPPIQADVAV